MHFTFVVNKAAGRGRGVRAAAYLEREIISRQIPAHCLYPKSPEETRRVARDHSGGWDTCLVAVGGDGTLSQLVAGMLEGGVTCHLGLLPAGSGNDFWRTTGLRVDPAVALDALVAARPVRCDYGRVTWIEEHMKYNTTFVNAAGIGFDAAVADTFRSVPLPGLPGYIMAAIVELLRFRPPIVEIVTYPGSLQLRQRLFFAYSGNGSFGGGGFRLVPEASLHDGLLDICLVSEVSFRRGLTLMPKALRGTHGSEPEVTIVRVPALTIRSTAPIPLHVDGEVLSRNVSEVHFEAVPAGLSIFYPTAEENCEREHPA